MARRRFRVPRCSFHCLLFSSERVKNVSATLRRNLPTLIIGPWLLVPVSLAQVTTLAVMA